jgi:hypothetical protein
MAYPRTWTVWYLKRVRKKCDECGKPIRKELVVVDPWTFRQFWSVAEILKETKAGRGDDYWRCYTS